MKAPFLCTTAISSIWDLNAELLILGPWCLTPESNRETIKNGHYTLLPAPFKPSIKIKDIVDYCQDIYIKLLPELTREFNKLHGVKYPEKYWRVLVGPWLLHFIGIIYDRFERIRLACEKFPLLNTNILPIEKCTIWSHNTLDFITMASEDDFFNLKIFSLITRRFGAVNFNEVDLRLPSAKTQAFTLRSLEACFKNWVKNRFAFGNRSIVLSDMYHITKRDERQMMLDSRFDSIRFMSFSNSINSMKSNFDPVLRRRILLKPALDNFVSFVTDILPSAIPICYIENFSYYKRKAEQTCNPKDKFFGSATGWYFNEELKYYAAEATLQGVQLLDFQHGGAYGSTLAAPPEDLSLEKDIFFTWGWNTKKGGCTIPLPSPHLSKLRNTHEGHKEAKALLIGTSIPRYHFRFDTALKTDDIQDYFLDKKRFITRLSDKIKPRVAYRPYNEYGWNEVGFIKSVCSDIQIADKGALVELMKRARMVIIDHPQTSFLESLSINVPTILFWNHDIYLMRPEAEPYFQKLRETGILFTNPEDAAKKVNEVFDDPEKWWLSNEVQQVRLEFCNTFALSSDDWKHDWAAAIRKLPNASNALRRSI